MAAKDSTPLEEFRRVTATTMRAVSRKEVNVAFVPDGGSLLGQEAPVFLGEGWIQAGGQRLLVAQGQPEDGAGVLLRGH